MKAWVMQYAQERIQPFSIQQISMNFLVALLLGFVIYLSYRFSHTNAVYSAKFNVSLLMLTLVTTMMMHVIGNNIALSLGMVGALSIVRFRTAIKDARDTVYIFWCIAVGICCGVSEYALVCMGSGLVFLVMCVMGSIKSNQRYLLMIDTDTALACKEVEAMVFRQYQGKAILRVANRTADKTEYIYELSAKMIQKSKIEQTNPMELFCDIEGVHRVHLVCQNEEMNG